MKYSLPQQPAEALRLLVETKKYYDRDLKLLRLAVSHQIIDNGQYRSGRKKAIGAANRFRKILAEEIAHAGGHLTVGMVYDAADDATLEKGVFAYGKNAEFYNDGRFSEKNQRVSDPENPWDIQKYQWVMGDDGNWRPREK